MSRMKRLLVTLAVVLAGLSALVAAIVLAFGDTKAVPAEPTALAVAPTVQPTQQQPAIASPTSAPSTSATPPVGLSATPRPTLTPRPSPTPVPPPAVRQVTGLFVEPRALP